MMIAPIRTFRDNYVWCLFDEAQRLATLVDPGEAEPVADFLARHELQLGAILVTHHHHDHTGGIPALTARHAVPVYGPGTIASVTAPVADGARVNPQGLPLTFDVWAIPGHTSDHLAFVAPGIALVGDTLFAAGCGRLFEGTAAEMHASLQRLNQLEATTQIYCAHEYTLANLAFALQVEPENKALLERFNQCQAIRAADQPTVPSTLADERATNPFLRCDQREVRDNVGAYWQTTCTDDLTTFTLLRRWKDEA